ncbi:3-oxoadipate enol-lactonase [Faunimonas sp. B44]|uniref:3-oxoadipate enol-lactonase n=1 Tax=Faunimonas sp. B44 TaxID=3461493 RepID=UPI004044A3E9
MAEFRTGDGISIHYQVEGDADAPPLVFSNSLGTNLHMWDGQMAEAAARFRVIRYDQRGHGRSEAPQGPYTMDRLGRDVIELLDALQIEKTAFCGLSMGGMTGLWLTANHPRRFSHAALCNTAAHLPPRDLWDGRIRTVERNGMAAIQEAVVERWFTPAFREENPGEVDRIRAMIAATDPTGYAGCCAAIRDMDLRDVLGLIETPVMIVVGEHDPATTPEQGMAIAARVLGARSERIPAAHLSNVEQPARFNAVVLPYLAGGR